MLSVSRRILLVILIAFSTACATVDFDADKPSSQALTNTTDTSLGKLFSKYADKPANESGFYLITDSLDALAVRLLIAERAERSIDAQYYMIDNDTVGKVFFASLLRAADRGVRVRLLIDDINTVGMEHKLAGLSDHPNIELRLFNPFANRSFRVFDAWDFQRINRRMHNKSLTVDNQITIIGGRNIATEYFAANRQYNFGDLDTLAVGPVVRDTSRMFDSYWSHRNAIPYIQLSEQSADGGKRLDAVRQSLEDNTDALRDTPYAAAVRESLEEFIEDGDKTFTWAPYQLIYDAPDKSLGSEEAEETPGIMTPLLRSVRSAQKSLMVVSPYFVPRSAAAEGLAELQASGIDLYIVTNSLASSDHLLVHGGYAASRKSLLRHGVKFCEIRGDLAIAGTEESKAKGTKSSLHTKAFIVDRRYFFMGSFNWDPRSADINTELGIIIDSPEIASRLSDNMHAAAPQACYEPFLDDKDRLRWRKYTNGQVEILTHEPDTSYFTRVKAALGRALPIRGQL
jgi:putative cardiolipin synthase